MKSADIPTHINSGYSRNFFTSFLLLQSFFLACLALYRVNSSASCTVQRIFSRAIVYKMFIDLWHCFFVVKNYATAKETLICFSLVGCPKVTISKIQCVSNVTQYQGDSTLYQSHIFKRNHGKLQNSCKRRDYFLFWYSQCFPRLYAKKLALKCQSSLTSNRHFFAEMRIVQIICFRFNISEQF